MKLHLIATLNLDIKLLDWSSGDICVNGKDMTGPEAEKFILSHEDSTPVALSRAYSKRHRGIHRTTVGDLRREKNGWWSW
jgi:hypothetical protein